MVYLHERITSPIIECFYTVYNELGPGFLESVYELAMMIELGKRHLNGSRQLRFLFIMMGMSSGGSSPTSWWKDW